MRKITIACVFLTILACTAIADPRPASESTAAPPAVGPLSSRQQQADQVNVGVYMPRTGTFNGLVQAYDGVVTWARYVNDVYGGIRMADGRVLRVNLIIRDDESSLVRAREIWQEFVDLGLKFVIGGHTSMTVPASEFFEQHGIINVQCCTGPDAVYTTDPKEWVLGIHRSSLDYPKGLLRQMSLRGFENVAIVYNTVSSFTISTADSAEAFAGIVGLNVIAKIPFDGTGYRNLTHPPGGPQIRAGIDRVRDLIRNGTKVSLFAITLGNDGDDVARYVEEQQLGLENLFITVAPTTDAFVPAVGRAAAEYVYSPLQWHNSMAFDDPLFSNSSHYQAVFQQHHNYTATYTTASGTAAGVALHLGIQDAATTDHTVVIQALREMRRDTFFGPMAFNRYQRNYGGATGTIQIQDGTLQGVLPDVSATVIPVMPMPTWEQRSRCPAGSGHRNLTECLDRLDAVDGSSSNTLLIAVLVPVVVIALAALALIGKTATSGSARNVANAPRDGRITIMFTDVQDSTKLWSTCPMAMSVALDTHHDVIRKAIDRHRCYEVKTAGDSFMIACPSEKVATDLAIDIQRDLLARQYPVAIEAVYSAQTDDELLAIDDDPDHLTGAKGSDSGAAWNGVRVRIGMHSGEPSVTFDEVTKGYDYYGPPVNVAARVESVGCGGQICASGALVKKLDLTGKDFETRSIGEFELKGVSEPTEIIEITPHEFVGKRNFVNGAGHATDAGAAGDSMTVTSQSTFVADPEVMDAVYSTLTTLTRIMRPAEREQVMKSLCKSWRIQWVTGHFDVNLSALTKRLAKAYRPTPHAALAHDLSGSGLGPSSSHHSAMHVENVTAAGAAKYETAQHD